VPGPNAVVDSDGYPMRLLLPGYEGNINVKYLRRIKLLTEPAMSCYESQLYTTSLPSGKAYQFDFVNEAKSLITRPSPGQTLQQPGLYEISGIAHSGKGLISKYWCQPTEGGVGLRLCSRSRCRACPLHDFGCRGAGAAPRLSCKDGPGTRIKTRSLPARSPSRRATLSAACHWFC
jgi:Oxidoreductase molybdopterin binding domain